MTRLGVVKPQPHGCTHGRNLFGVAGSEDVAAATVPGTVHGCRVVAADVPSGALQQQTKAGGAEPRMFQQVFVADALEVGVKFGEGAPHYVVVPCS